MTATDITAFFTTATASVESVLEGSIPVILGVFALLVGLGIAVRYFKKWIGRKA